MKKLYNKRPIKALGTGLAILPLFLAVACTPQNPADPFATPDLSKITGSPTALVAATLAQVPHHSVPTRTPTPAAGASLKGQLDTSFGKGGMVTTDLGDELDEAKDVAIQSDGKIVVLGETWPKDVSMAKFALVRYDTSGNIDQSFGDGGKIIPNIIGNKYDSGNPHALALQPDDKIVAVGTTWNLDLHQDVFAVLRYNADGTPDTSFANGGSALTPISQEANSHAEDEGHAVALQPDGKIVVAGYSGLQGGKDYQDYTMVRYNSDGSLDEAFGDKGRVMTDFGQKQDWAFAIALHPDGKITLAGPVETGVRLCGGYTCSVFSFGLAQYNPDGSLDTKFGYSGKMAQWLSGSDGNYDLIRMPDGKLLTSGHIENEDFAMTLLNPDGSLDKSFGNDGWVETSFGKYNEHINAIAMQPDGKVVAAGMVDVDPIDILNNDFGLARYR